MVGFPCRAATAWTIPSEGGPGNQLPMETAVQMA